jgi:hypothetical protein
MTNDHDSPRKLAKRVQLARYVVSVDHQPKSSFESREAAENEARRISEAFPILAVRVTDTERGAAKEGGAT